MKDLTPSTLRNRGETARDPQPGGPLRGGTAGGGLLAAGGVADSQSRGASFAEPFPVDIHRLLWDVNSAFNPLHPDRSLQYHVKALDAENVMLSVSLQRDMLRTFVHLLDSLHGLFRVFDNKGRSSLAEFRSQEVDLFELQDRDIAQGNFRADVLALFDQFTSEGQTPKNAIKETRRAMKAKQHPWATHSLIRDVIRSSGRLRLRRG